MKTIAIIGMFALTVSLLAGCSSRETEGEKVSSSPSPTAETLDLNEDESSNLGHWGRAMGSVLLYLNDGNPYYFGGYEANESNREATIRILSSSWNINSRKQLLKQINNLLEEGDRTAFKEEAKEMAAMSKKELKTAMKQLSGDILIHYREVRYNWKTWGSKGLLAWDMCRISHLVQWGHIAGYLSLEEAQALIEPAAKKLKKHFDNWEDVQMNWLDGYCLYATVDRDADGNDYTNRKTIYEKIRDSQPDNEILYDDSMFSGDIIPLQDLSYKTILKELSAKSTAKKSSGKNKTKKNKNDAASSAEAETEKE
ncbi:MAG: DUF1266 domain-containing protein [Clostridiaceae bacterium]|nr:DUF1266 domain-containing protein [Clostridiaceae bacterium]